MTAARTLSDRWCHQRKHEGGAAVLAPMESRDGRGQGPEALEQDRLVTGSVRTNANRMVDPAYQAKGWPIGSGSRESGCKTVIGQRLGGGKRWGVEGADSVSQLRALFRSEPSQGEAFWNQSRN